MKIFLVLTVTVNLLSCNKSSSTASGVSQTSGTLNEGQIPFYMQLIGPIILGANFHSGPDRDQISRALQRIEPVSNTGLIKISQYINQESKLARLCHTLFRAYNPNYDFNLQAKRYELNDEDYIEGTFLEAKVFYSATGMIDFPQLFQTLTGTDFIWRQGNPVAATVDVLCFQTKLFFPSKLNDDLTGPDPNYADESQLPVVTGAYFLPDTSSNLPVDCSSQNPTLEAGINVLLSANPICLFASENQDNDHGDPAKLAKAILDGSEIMGSLEFENPIAENSSTREPYKAQNNSYLENILMACEYNLIPSTYTDRVDQECTGFIEALYPPDQPDDFSVLRPYKLWSKL